MATSGIDVRLARALSHPLRQRILMALGGRVASPTDLADELGAPLGDVAYHVKQLAGSDLLELVRTERRRGAVKHLYRAKRWLAVEDAEWEAMPADERLELARHITGQVVAELQGAQASEELGEVDVHLSRSPLRLDEPALTELNALLRDLAERAQRLQAESRERSARGGGGPERDRMLALLHFGSVREG